MWAEDPHRILQAIEKVEQAWTLTHDPKIAIQLATMYDLANRNQDALVVLQQASHADPRHPLLRHHAAIALLRHGAPADIRNFFTSVSRIDPDDAFAQFVISLLDSYDVWVDQLVSSIDRERDGRQPFIISCPVWGKPFADSFIRYICAALLSPNNLPELAKRCSVHLVIFTTAETESHLIADPLFARLKEYATVRFVHYTENQINYGKSMEAHYGHEEVFYSDRSLAFYYARNCKFALMSCAHYVALAAGRATDAFVSCQVADTLLNDGALTQMAARLADGVDAVLINCIQIDGEVLRPALDHSCRRDDGVLQISSDDCARILAEHLPEYNFVGPGDLPRMRLRICWRVGADGILIHGNHYHPICLRPRRVRAPAAIDHRSHRQSIHRSFVARNGQDPSRPGCEYRRTVAGGLAARATGARRWASPHRRCRLLVMGVLGPAPRGVLSVAAALRPCDIRRRVDACRGCRFRRRRCHRRSSGALRREPPSRKVVAFVTSCDGVRYRSCAGEPKGCASSISGLVLASGAWPSDRRS